MDRTDIKLIEAAAALLDRHAEELRIAHTGTLQPDWTGEAEAKAAYDETKVTSEKLYVLAKKMASLSAPLSQQEPFAWATFDGEGSYDLRLYDGNEDYREQHIQRNGENYAGWVEPLYVHPHLPTQHADKIKDHHIALAVNALRDVALKFYSSPQLRERIARILVPLAKGGAPDGWVLVPRTLTQEMRTVMENETCVYQNADALYDDLIAVAPIPEQDSCNPNSGKTEAQDALSTRDEALEEAALLFSQPRMAYLGGEVQDAIRALKSQPAPVATVEDA